MLPCVLLKITFSPYLLDSIQENSYKFFTFHVSLICDNSQLFDTVKSNARFFPWKLFIHLITFGSKILTTSQNHWNFGGQIFIDFQYFICSFWCTGNSIFISLFTNTQVKCYNRDFTSVSCSEYSKTLIQWTYSYWLPVYSGFTLL